MLSIFRTVESKMIPQTQSAPTLVDVRPALPIHRLEKHPVHALHESYLTEYAELAQAVGVTPPDLAIESFKAALVKLDIPIFSLQEVITYMDAKAAKESKQQAGWEWRPLRTKDNRQMRFGRACEHPDGRYDPPRRGVPASDYYAGPTHAQEVWYALGNNGHEKQVREYDKSAEQVVYDRTIPLHALRRVAAIEREFTGNVAFFVSDYALLPSVLYPDPFLMAVIPNVNVPNGTGRFVIDFWDEPGFGIEQMLK